MTYELLVIIIIRTTPINCKTGGEKKYDIFTATTVKFVRTKTY